MSKAAKNASGWSSSVTPGRSLLEIIWEELDVVVDRLMGEYADCDPEDLTTFDDPEDVLRWGEVRGQAQGLAYALAVLTTPYDVDVDAIREQSVERAQLREATGRSTPETAHEWKKDDVAYHRGRKLKISSVGTQFAYVSSENRTRFNVPLHELRTHEEEYGTS